MLHHTRILTLLYGLFIAAASAIPQSADATALIGQTEGGVKSKFSPDGKFEVSLARTPVISLEGPLAAELQMLSDIYVSYTFAAGPAGTGSFNIIQYDAFAVNTLGGADFTALYDDGREPARSDYNWIQIAYPTNWGDRDSKPLVDSLVFASPFYDGLSPRLLPTALTPRTFFGPAVWLSQDYPQQKVQNPAGGGKFPAGDLILVDEPYCSYTCVKDNIGSALIFDLYLTTFTAPEFDESGNVSKKGAVSVLDGFSWACES